MVSAAIADKQLNLKISGNMLAKDEKFLKIISSYRSPAYQAILRKRKPNADRAKIALRSAHFTGRALDIYVGGEPVKTKDSNRVIQVQTPVYKWACEKRRQIWILSVLLRTLALGICSSE